MMRRSHDLAGIAAVLGASLVWGTSFLLARWAMIELPVRHVVLYRYLFASLFVLPILATSRVRLRHRDLPLVALTGFLMVPVTIILQFEGLARTSATSTALMVGVGTPLLALAGWLVEKEHLGRRGWSAVALSTLGLVILVGDSRDGNDWIGNLLVLSSIVVSVIWVLTSKRLVRRYPALFVTSWILVFGTLFLIPLSLIGTGLPTADLTQRTWLALIALGLFCTTLAYVAWNWGVARIGASKAGVYLNFEPLAGAMLGITVLGEASSLGLLLGGALILGAAWWISIEPPGEPAAPFAGAAQEPLGLATEGP